MQTLFIQYVFLILLILALVMLANKIKVAYPIVLLLGGLLLSFTSAFSHITIDPELVFFTRHRGKRHGKSFIDGEE